MSKLVLASSSIYRRQLLERLGHPFEVDPAALDESPLAAETPGELVTRLSRAKAAAVARRHRTALVIASDQVGVLDGRILNKPGSMEAARAQLRQASGKAVQFLTGLCVLDSDRSRERFALESCRVEFRQLSDASITDYVEREQPLDCAGSFKIEGLGIALFRRLELDDPTALEGLPLIRLVQFLDELGVPVLRP